MTGREIDVEAMRRSLREYLGSFDTREEQARALADFLAEMVERMAAEQGPEAAAQLLRAARAIVERMIDAERS